MGDTRHRRVARRVGGAGVKRLVLAGGGHAHIEVLRRFGDEPMGDVEVVLVSPAADTPYSGMLPGLVAGHYSWRDCHIDLDVLTRHAGAKFRQTCVTGIDPAQRHIVCDSGLVLGWDVLSLDIGSTPPVGDVDGAAQHGITVKPVERFLVAWEGIVARAITEPLRVVAVGGGAGGVELCLAMQHRLASTPQAQPCDVTLVTQSATIVPEYAQGARRRLRAAFARHGIGLLAGVAVTAVDDDGLVLANGARVPADVVVWTTGAAAPVWLRDTGLALDARGFVEVDEHLQSTSHPGVFAAGDVAAYRGKQVPKSGVYAVRQGPPLADNLRLALEAKPLLPWKPQRRTLALLSTGDARAVAVWGSWSAEGSWVWRWKNHIDTRFVQRYRMAP